MIPTIDPALSTVVLYGAAALVASLILVLAMGASLHADLVLRRHYLPAVTFGIIVVPAIAVLIGGRDVTSLSFADLERATGLATMFLRVCSVALVGATAIRLVSSLVDPAPAPLGPAALLISLLVFVLAHQVLNAVFGTSPAIPSTQAIYASLLLVGVYVSRQPGLRAVVLSAKSGLFLVMVGSLALLAIDPGMVRQQAGAELRLPGVDFRLFGLASNPNGLAALASISLLLTFHMPFRSWLLEAANIAATLGVLVLAQSQTMWMATLVAVPVLLLGRSHVRLLDRRPLLVMITVASVIAAASLGAAFYVSPDLSLDNFVSGQRYRELTSLTGRRAIWDLAMNEWRENPLFGYGPQAWGLRYRERVGMGYAFTAHNQALQSLSQAGLVGLLALLGYLATLAWLAFTAPRPARGLALALFAMVGVQLLTAVPLHLATPFGEDYLSHYLLFVVLLIAHTRAQNLPSAVYVSSLQPEGVQGTGPTR